MSEHGSRVPTRDQPREARCDGLDPVRRISGARLITRCDVAATASRPGRRSLCAADGVSEMFRNSTRWDPLGPIGCRRRILRTWRSRVNPA